MSNANFQHENSIKTGKVNVGCSLAGVLSPIFWKLS